MPALACCLRASNQHPISEVSPCRSALRRSSLPDWEGQPWHEVEGGPVRFLVHRRQLAAIESPQDQASMARVAVTQVVIETSSFCNRTCVFCPNVSGLRAHAEHHADAGLRPHHP
jgi:hypothetical protein